MQHHERLDGSGYPRGIKGGEILLETKILTVADVVEAMASHPYRPSLGIGAALSEIAANAGKYYDPEVARMCIALFREKDAPLPGRPRPPERTQGLRQATRPYSHSIINGACKPLSCIDVFSATRIFTVRFTVNFI